VGPRHSIRRLGFVIADQDRNLGAVGVAGLSS
jgi:hypothetical protein